MASSFQSSWPNLRETLIEIVYNIRATVHQLLGCTPFEAQFGHKLNTIWYSITRAASTDNLFSLDRNKKIFPATFM